MKYSYTAALLATLVCKAASLACTSGTMYCGHTLVEGNGWSYNDVSRQGRDSTPNGYGISQKNLGRTLWKCDDRWYWTNADLDFDSVCENGCVNAGHGKNDYCA